MLANVVLLTMIAPLATDMYVPAFPVVGRDLGASEDDLVRLGSLDPAAVSTLADIDDGTTVTIEPAG